MLVLLHRSRLKISFYLLFIILYKFFNLIASGHFHLTVNGTEQIREDWERLIRKIECNKNNRLKKCKKGWNGSNCNQNVSLSCTSNDTISESIQRCYCINGGKCIESKCVCPFGFRGQDCEKCIPNSRCKGFCRRRPDECTCPFGKGGQFCEKDLIFCTHNSPCQNGGICQNNAEGTFTCRCSPGFGGRNCERRLTSCEKEPCYNGAKCITLSSSHSFRCLCSSYFFGRFCEVKAPNGCHDLPCQNGGSCVDLANLLSNYSSKNIQKNSFKCICPEGWTGPICELPLGRCKKNPCHNGGSCVNEKDNYVCLCPFGWSGAKCENKLTNPCLNGGTCVTSMNAFHCYCKENWEGEICQNRVWNRQLRHNKSDCDKCLSKRIYKNNLLIISLLLAFTALLFAFISLFCFILRFLPLHIFRYNSNNLRKFNNKNEDSINFQKFQKISFISSKNQRKRRKKHSDDILLSEHLSPRYVPLPTTQNNKTTNSVYEEIDEQNLFHQNFFNIDFN